MSASQPQQHLLVIGYGNTLRRDDGAGPRVAQAVAAMNLSGVRVIVGHQLFPELAEPVSQAGGVIFIDASVSAKNGVELRELNPLDDRRSFAHTVDPCSVLELARKVFGHCPPAWSLAIPIEDIGFGDVMSARAEAGIQAALKLFRRSHPRLQCSVNWRTMAGGRKFGKSAGLLAEAPVGAVDVQRVAGSGCQ